MSEPQTDADLEWLTIDDDEELVWESGPDRRTLLPVVLIGIPLSIVLIGLVIIAAEYLRVTNTQYVVTNRALYRKTGILSRDVKRIEHEKVQDSSYSQSALGTRLGYGTVEISTAGGSGVEMSFKSVPDPTGVQQLLSEQLDRTRRGRRGRGAPQQTDSEPQAGSDATKADVLVDIRTELRTIRELLEESEGAHGTGPSDDRDRHAGAGARTGTDRTHTDDNTETNDNTDANDNAETNANRSRTHTYDDQSSRS
ncbi:PH domain-containing protein [Natrialba sp. PRR66]|uniref:PH domain-containing protein n=1 Tax=Natrialba sp. PRR66 TaxID=3098146 RepID=UPI002B1D9970|nr:PH domain-containing protein [Natrialba sp. PRR66]